MNTKPLVSLIILISIVILGYLFHLIYFAEHIASDNKYIALLPYLNASLNSLSAIFVIIGVRAIRRNKKVFHIKMMLTATAFSGLFLISYIIYHKFHGDTKFLATGWIRPTYFFILISHIILSVALVPLLLYTISLGFLGKFETHKKIAKITYPIWLYVSITGVVIVAMIKLLNPS